MVNRPKLLSPCRRCLTPTRAPLCVRCAIHHAARIEQARQRDRERVRK